MKPYRNNKLREAARGAPCFMYGPTCTGGGEARGDVCLRHSNSIEHGKATGTKANDFAACYACQNCEDWYSGLTGGDVDERNALFAEAVLRTHRYAYGEGVFP